MDGIYTSHLFVNRVRSRVAHLLNDSTHPGWDRLRERVFDDAPVWTEGGSPNSCRRWLVDWPAFVGEVEWFMGQVKAGLQPYPSKEQLHLLAERATAFGESAVTWLERQLEGVTHE